MGWVQTRLVHVREMVEGTGNGYAGEGMNLLYKDWRDFIEIFEFIHWIFQKFCKHWPVPVWPLLALICTLYFWCWAHSIKHLNRYHALLLFHCFIYLVSVSSIIISTFKVRKLSSLSLDKTYAFELHVKVNSFSFFNGLWP